MNAPTVHPTDAALRAYLSGKSTELELDQIEQHLERCDDCFRRLEQLEESEDSGLFRRLREAHRRHSEDRSGDQESC